jgi:hypothetical protein
VLAAGSLTCAVTTDARCCSSAAASSPDSAAAPSWRARWA